MFFEVIRRAPNIPDPYTNLGVIYEELNDRKRALEFYMIAAHILGKCVFLLSLLGAIRLTVAHL